ncbi:MAG: hypothetical protein JO341_13535 [Gammaproteobacteria bacterium]|nr:hypothetical protein [Gammaproteobacteria bacterium]
MTPMPLRTLALRCLLGCAAWLATGAALAQDADPPTRAARLSDVEGSVSLQPTGVQDWTAAPLNRPLTVGDKVWADRDARVEVDLGAAVLRAGSTTGFSFLNLDDRTAQVQLTAGTLIVRVRDLQDGEVYEVDTPNLAVTLQQNGEYRVDVNDAGDTTTVEVSEGSAQADSAGQAYTVSAQQAITVAGDSPPQLATLGAPDDLDAWSSGRERALEDSPSRAYVADDMAGTADLDANGSWQSTPDYGYVWTPRTVASGWVPYRFGHWAWIIPWGWTWIDDAPWGFAPFHYGRWVMWNSAWCWVPGPRRVRPVYAPALVAWVGSPAYGEPGAFGPNVGWFPLAPREVYVAPYRVSPTYARNVNITNTTIVNTTVITNVYQNNVTNVRYVNNTPAAVTAVSRATFTSGERVGTHAVPVTSALLATAAVAAAAPALIPARQSVLGPPASRAVARPPAAVLNRPVLARTPPAHAPPPIERQAAAIQANGGKPLPRTELARLAPAAAPTPVRVLPPSRGTSSVRGAPPPAPAPSDMAGRERALQNARTAPAPRGGPAEAPRAPVETRAPTPPAPRNDRPASAAAPAPREYAPAPRPEPAGSAPPVRRDYAPPPAPASRPESSVPAPPVPARDYAPPAPRPRPEPRATAPAPAPEAESRPQVPSPPPRRDAERVPAPVAAPAREVPRYVPPPPRETPRPAPAPQVERAPRETPPARPEPPPRGDPRERDPRDRSEH